MIVYALALHQCTTQSGMANPDNYVVSCQWSGGGMLYTSSAGCERAGRVEIAKTPLDDDIAGVTHKYDKFQCLPTSVSE